MNGLIRNTRRIMSKLKYDKQWFETQEQKLKRLLHEVSIPVGRPKENKLGHWIDKGSLSCRCSKCGCKSPKEYPYCPNCGTQMEK